MGLFSASVTEKINQIAAKSTEPPKSTSSTNTRSMNDELNQISKKVVDYFSDSPAILITTKEQLHEYVDKCIENGYAGIDTETTGLDRIHDHVVGASLYTPGLPECYIPMKHIVPIFDNLYKDQLTYEEVGEELSRFTELKNPLSEECKVKLIFANADFDLAMIYKDLKADLINAFYYDVITAWRCLKENENDNSLKGLYAKYVKKGAIDPKKFSDFFPVKLFPNCKPKVAALYAANDAKITYELFLWQLPYVTVTHDKCKKNHLEKIANLVWNIEFPMVRVCAMLHRRGVYLDDSISATLHERYTAKLKHDEADLAADIQELIDTKDVVTNRNRPFRTGKDFNPNSNPHVKYLLNNLLGSTAKTTGKEVLKDINKPATKDILNVRGDVKLLGTYVDKLPRSTAKDHRVHASFKAIGAATGRMCIAENSYVNTVNKGHIKIKDVTPGDIVFCYNEITDEVMQSTVLNKWKTGENKKCVSIKYVKVSDSTCPHWLYCTPEHQVYTQNRGWIEARLLEKGDLLIYIQCTGRISEPDKGFSYVDRYEYAVVDVTVSKNRYDVYDIEVADYHNFFVANILVHNSSEAPNMQNIPSHALDIRHMFRATPEQTELIKVDYDDGVVEITLSKYDSIPSLAGKIKINELQKGDIVILYEGVVTQVRFKVAQVSFNLDKATLILTKETADDIY